jgi:hypothetical protein
LCRKPAYFPDEDAIKKMPENVALSRLVAKHRQKESKEGEKQPAAEGVAPDCQVC